MRSTLDRVKVGQLDGPILRPFLCPFRSLGRVWLLDKKTASLQFHRVFAQRGGAIAYETSLLFSSIPSLVSFHKLRPQGLPLHPPSSPPQQSTLLASALRRREKVPFMRGRNRAGEFLSPHESVLKQYNLCLSSERVICSLKGEKAKTFLPPPTKGKGGHPPISPH